MGANQPLSTQGYLNYRKTFAQDHTIEGTVGFDYMKNTVNGLSLTVTGADSDKVPTLAAGTDATGWADTNTNEALSSYFGRLNYDYRKKYLFMFTFRADGCRNSPKETAGDISLRRRPAGWSRRRNSGTCAISTASRYAPRTA